VWSFPHATLMYYESPGLVHSEKLATFDFDGCLANTSLFKKGPDAWSVLFPSIPAHLKTLHDSGYKLVIFTNQSDIGKAAKPETREKAIAEKRVCGISLVHHLLPEARLLMTDFFWVNGL